MNAILLLSGAVISMLLWSPVVRAQGMTQNNPVYKELAELGRMTTGQIDIVYGVPCVEVMLESGESIMTLVHSIPSLKISNRSVPSFGMSGVNPKKFLKF